MFDTPEEIKAKAKIKAEFLEKAAREENDANLYDAAAKYYAEAGNRKKANECYEAAEAIRHGK